MSIPKTPTEEEKVGAKKIRLQSISNRYWGAVAVVKVCQLAAEYNNEMTNGVELSHLPEALGLAFDVLTEIGLDVMPALNLMEGL